VVKLLLEKGAELEATERDGWTPLLWAAGNGHEAVAKLLLKKARNWRIRIGAMVGRRCHMLHGVGTRRW
jgi:ankyrin repeat protein